MVLYEKLENDVYSMDVRVGFEECDGDLLMKPSDLLKYVIRTAGFHYDLRGVSHRMMYENGQIFVLSRLSARIYGLPEYNEKITVQTWEKEAETVFAPRDFEVFSESGERLCSVKSSWILINPHTRAILRPKAYNLCKYRPIERNAEALPCSKIKPADEGELIDSRKVRPSDTDANGHLHSAFYTYFVTDALYGKRDGACPKDIGINFVKEAKAGDTLDIYAKADGDSVTVTAKNGDETCFTALLTY